jgi:hypothetical protein
MHPDLRAFLRQFAAVVAMGLVPVVMTAFLSMPYTLGRHPGERVAGASSSALATSATAPRAPGAAKAG